MQYSKILHIIDDRKFIKMCELTFDIPEVNNDFVSSRNWVYIPNQYDVIVVHSITLNNREKLLKYSGNTPLVWFFWGGDGFKLGKFYNIFLSDKTKKVRLKTAFKMSLIHGFNTLIKTFFPSIIDRLPQSQKLLKVINKFDVVVPVIPNDFELLKSFYSVKPKMFHLNYVNPVFKNEIIDFNNGCNILLGNSSSYTNNHVEIIDQLAGLNLHDRKVIIPLNYGNPKYAEYIEKYSLKKLGASAECLMEFLPFEEYQKKLQSCGIMIMNHKRQQALGNIMQALYSGVHVYLNSQSELYNFLKSKDFTISETNNLETLTPLSLAEKNKNRTKCISVFGEKGQHKKLRKLLKQVI